MNVLHISRFFHPVVGGTENFIAALASAVSPSGVSSRVLVTDRVNGGGGPQPQIPVQRIPTVGPARFPLPRGGRRAIECEFRWADIVHIHDIRFLLGVTLRHPLLRTKPIVVSTHGLIFHTPKYAALKRLLWRTYFRRCLEQASVVVAVSPLDYELCLPLQRATEVVLIPNGVSIPITNGDLRPRRTNALLYFGRLDSNKGVEQLGDVLARAPADWTLTIAGTGDQSYVRALRKQFRQFRDRVRFEGVVSDRALQQLCSTHGCALLPSRYEAFGMTLVEALATGIPVVASDIPAYREATAGSTVPLVDFSRPEEVVAEIVQARETWDAAGAARVASRYSWEARAPTWVHLYETIGANSTRRGAVRTDGNSG